MNISSVLFAVLVAGSLLLFFYRFCRIIARIRTGRAGAFSWKGFVTKVVEVPMRIFTRPVAGILHTVLFASFIVIFIILIEMIVDGLSGSSRIFSNFGWYRLLNWWADILAWGALIASICFLWRRDFLKVSRFNSNDLSWWNRLDANLILVLEVLISLSFILLAMADTMLYGIGDLFPLSNVPSNLLWFTSEPFLEGFSMVAWWAHILLALFFLNYLIYSKHLHILMSYPSLAFSRGGSAMVMEPLPFVQKEVFGDTGTMIFTEETLGVRDITDLYRRDLIGAYACTECGRCTAVCPAWQSGKVLSPRAVVMAVRDRAENFSKNADNTLLYNYISTEQVNACTMCGACVHACPLAIDPLSIIRGIRRYNCLEEGLMPPSWNEVSAAIGASGNPWGMPQNMRTDWIQKNER